MWALPFSLVQPICCNKKNCTHNQKKIAKCKRALKLIITGTMTKRKAKWNHWAGVSHSVQQMSHQRWIWGIHCTHVTNNASEGSILALKPRADVTRSPKQRYEWSDKNYFCAVRIFFKRNKQQTKTGHRSMITHLNFTGGHIRINATSFSRWGRE